MVAKIIDGKALANSVRMELQQQVQQLQQQHNLTPGLATVLVGEDPASQTYVRMKHKACEQVGIYSEQHNLSATISQDELLNLIESFNHNPQFHGILVQLPLPPHIDTLKILESVDRRKDVDGFHPSSVGNLWTGQECFVPCTPLGIMRMLEHEQIALKGKNATVVGRSNIVGKPVAALLLAEHATVTICHSRTQDLPAVCRQADVLVAAVGRPLMIKQDWIKPGAIVIDVGVNRVEIDGASKLVGDVDFDNAKLVAGAITPVPGGVGPMTITMLLANTITSAARSLNT